MTQDPCRRRTLTWPRALLSQHRERPVSRRQRQAGMLLLDAMLAILVGTFVILSAYLLSMTAAVAGAASHQNNQAYQAARQIIENTRLAEGADVVDGTYTATIDEDGVYQLFGSVQQLSELQDGAATMTVSTYRDPVKQVSVTVTWKGRTGNNIERTRTRTLTTLFTPHGIAP